HDGALLRREGVPDRVANALAMQLHPVAELLHEIIRRAEETVFRQDLRPVDKILLSHGMTVAGRTSCRARTRPALPWVTLLFGCAHLAQRQPRFALRGSRTLPWTLKRRGNTAVSRSRVTSAVVARWSGGVYRLAWPGPTAIWQPGCLRHVALARGRARPD